MNLQRIFLLMLVVGLIVIARRKEPRVAPVSPPPAVEVNPVAAPQDGDEKLATTAKIMPAEVTR